MNDLSGFGGIAPYLNDPLILAGFALFLFFLALRFVIGKLPVVTEKVAGIALLRLASLGFVLAIVVIVFGFGVRYVEIQSDRQRLEAEHQATLEIERARAALAEQALAAARARLEREVENYTAQQEQLRTLTAAVDALTQQEDPGIDAALEALAQGDTTEAKGIFRRITEDRASAIQGAAAA